MSDSLKSVVRLVALVCVLPAFCSFRVRTVLFGSDRALMGSTEALGLVPGMTGQYLRRAFLTLVLERCAPTAAIEWGTVFSDTGARIDDYAYIGPNCHIGLAHIEHDVLIGPAVHIPSGRVTHGMADPDQPLRNQEGERQVVRIGANSWIGSSAVIMADVGAATVVGAGAVVTKPLPSHVVAAGVPARVVRHRGSGSGAPA